ncbi:MAG: PIN domain-containing protein [Candidatus Woesearchaeota archaeon]
MRVILDVNILLSALIKDSKTREILLKSGFDFYFPEPSVHKLRKYQKYIVEKSGMTEQAYQYVLVTLFNFIKLIPTEDVKNRWKEAKEIMEHVDPEDVIFIACSLSLDNPIIWSDDKDFEKQNKVIVLKTKDIVDLFQMKEFPK